MRPQRRETPLRPGPGTVPALERQPRRPPVLGTATTAARLNRTTTPLNGADLAEVHAGYSRARSQDFRILTDIMHADDNFKVISVRNQLPKQAAVLVTHPPISADETQ